MVQSKTQMEELCSPTHLQGGLRRVEKWGAPYRALRQPVPSCSTFYKARGAGYETRNYFLNFVEGVVFKYRSTSSTFKSSFENLPTNGCW